MCISILHHPTFFKLRRPIPRGVAPEIFVDCIFQRAADDIGEGDTLSGSALTRLGGTENKNGGHTKIAWPTRYPRWNHR